MSKKLNHPGIIQHKEWAKDLKDINRRLNQMLLELQDAYGVSSREVTLVLRTKEELGRLRSRLDSNVIMDNPHLPLHQLTFYYKLGG
ncbi:MAG: hypothetical protein M9949_14395 [Candidatus Kapabacteria bacterium]|nr:hypothetical protein [Candidatus Kapabacteria bacterium]